METITRLCGLALRQEVQWPLDAFTDDPYLDTICPDLRQTVVDGNVNIPSFCPCIYFENTDGEGNFIIHCNAGFNSENKKVKQKQFTWNVEQVKKFLDYIEEKGIEPC